MADEVKTSIEGTTKKRRRPGPSSRRPQSKRHVANLSKIDSNAQYTVEEAIGFLLSGKKSNFDETVEIVMKLGIDPRKSDQLVRGSVSLPNGTGKSVKVIVFAEGDLAREAQEAGADEVGAQDLADKIQKENWLDFDIVIAHPNMMRFVGKLGRVLGPKGKMPSPKSGTVTEDVVTAVKEFKAGKVEYRTDSGGNVHAPIGKLSFSNEDLVANVDTFVEHIRGVKPSSSKGTYIQKVVVSSSMGPGIALRG
jgi:large subunit ribosomal protein L1